MIQANGIYFCDRGGEDAGMFLHYDGLIILPLKLTDVIYCLTSIQVSDILEEEYKYITYIDAL